MYENIATLLKISNENNKYLWETILENEIKISEKTEKEIFDDLDKRYEVMLYSANKALKKELNTVGGLIAGVSKSQNIYAEQDNTISGNFINRLMARALSGSEVNASMGKICAAPTAGACGILPAVLISVSEKYNSDRRKTLEALLIATGIGAVVMKNATVSGAEGGCQAECGVAAAMAAASAVYLSGGDNDTSINASSFALINVMGLVCDPIAGLVQVPCAQRNASNAVNAVISADLALAGMKCIIPLDEVIEAMFKVGHMLPSDLKETAMGGIAATATGKNIFSKIFN